MNQEAAVGPGIGAALAKVLVPSEDELLVHADACLYNFREAAIELAATMESLQIKGYKPQAVADHCDLPLSTVRRWMKTGRVFRVPWGTYCDD